MIDLTPITYMKLECVQTAKKYELGLNSGIMLESY